MNRSIPGKLYVITPHGSLPAQALPEEPTLAQWQSAVGGYIERVRVRFLGEVRDAFVNEEGRLENLPLNYVATAMLAPPFGGTLIVGNLAIWVPNARNATHV